MLSEREARALRQIEQQLATDDPRLAARMSRGRPGRPARGPWDVQKLAIGAALVSAAVCLAVGAVGAGLATALFAGALLWARRSLGRGPAPRRRRGWWRAGSG